MPLCCSKKAAQRQKEYEEEIRMRKLEEDARLAKEQREREEQRRAEIERIMQEEKQNQVLQKLAEEKAMKQRMADMEAEKQKEMESARKQEKDKRDEAERAQREKAKAPVVRMQSKPDESVYHPPENDSVYTQQEEMSKHQPGSVDASFSASQQSISLPHSTADEEVLRHSYTPFDMAAVDQTARYMANKCGCSMNPSHKVSECAICSAIDLSDAPLIA